MPYLSGFFGLAENCQSGRCREVSAGLVSALVSRLIDTDGYGIVRDPMSDLKPDLLITSLAPPAPARTAASRFSS
jgi:hypothetical protein